MKKLISYTLCYFLSVATLLQAHLYIIDINDTVTLRNDVDPEKTETVVLGQLVAQNMKLKSGVSVELYIKKVITDKTRQRLTYGALEQFFDGLRDKELLSDDEYDRYAALHNEYTTAWSLSKGNGGCVFASLLKLIAWIEKNDKAPRILFQSFGEEIDFVLDYLDKEFKRRNNLKWVIEQNKGVVDSEGDLQWHHEVYTQRDYQEINPFKNQEFFPFFSISAWRTNYQAWKNKGIGKLIFNGNGKTFFFDDNADACATIVVDKECYSYKEHKGLLNQLSSIHVFNVDTGKALTDDNYFVELILGDNPE
jgi:hypothetical protein